MGADIKVILEIAKPELIDEHCLWFGTNPNQGIAITASPSYTLTPLPEKAGAPKYVILIQVEASISFTLLPYGRFTDQKKQKNEFVFLGVISREGMCR